MRKVLALGLLGLFLCLVVVSLGCGKQTAKEQPISKPTVTQATPTEKPSETPTSTPTTVTPVATQTEKTSSEEIFKAVEKGNIEKVRQLLEVNPNLVNTISVTKYDQRLSLLSLAIINGYRDIVELLINRGANINSKDGCYDGNDMPIHYAARNGYKDIVELLLVKGARINEKDDFGGNTPLHYAVEKGHKSVVELLLSKGADVNARNKGRFAGKGYYELDGTPLHVASYYGYRDIALLLINKGARINERNKDGKTPLSLALEYGHWGGQKSELVELLRQHGAIDKEKPTEITQPKLYNTPEAQPKAYQPSYSETYNLYTNTGTGHWVSENMNGEFIKLEDGSLWEIDSYYRVDTTLWLVTDDIVVKEHKLVGGKMTYLLINTNNKEKAEAVFIKFTN